MRDVMTRAHFIVKDGKMRESCVIPGYERLSWHCTAIMTVGNVSKGKIIDVCPIIWAEEFDYDIIRMAYNIPIKRFDVKTEYVDEGKPCGECEK